MVWVWFILVISDGSFSLIWAAEIIYSEIGFALSRELRPLEPEPGTDAFLPENGLLLIIWSEFPLSVLPLSLSLATDLGDYWY